MPASSLSSEPFFLTPLTISLNASQGAHRTSFLIPPAWRGLPEAPPVRRARYGDFAGVMQDKEACRAARHPAAGDRKSLRPGEPNRRGAFPVRGRAGQGKSHRLCLPRLCPPACLRNGIRSAAKGETSGAHTAGHRRCARSRVTPLKTEIHRRHVHPPVVVGVGVGMPHRPDRDIRARRRGP